MKKARKIKAELTSSSSFEGSIKRAEEITSLLEDGNLPLQKRVEKFEEGIKLLKECEEELKNVELTIQKVIDKTGGIELEKVK